MIFSGGRFPTTEEFFMKPLFFLFALLPAVAQAGTISGKYFNRVIFVLFENTDYQDALAQPFFSELSKSGANFSNFLAETHPSQGNYIALTSGALNGVHNDNPVDLNVSNLADLLDAKGITWKVYAEDYPGNCFTGKSRGGYYRKHNPFISYTSISRNPTRCANIVDGTQFDADVASGNLPQYVFYIPNSENDGHDTDAAFADRWYSGKFGKLVSDTSFMNGTLLVSTFDESGGLTGRNQVYTSLVGSMVLPGSNASESQNHYSLLKLVEENWNLGDLGKEDTRALPISGIWKSSASE